MIQVTIPPRRSFNYNIYYNNKDCYLAQALKKLGYKKVYVSGDDLTIGDKAYKWKGEYDTSVLRNAFYAKKDINLKIVRKY